MSKTFRNILRVFLLGVCLSILATPQLALSVDKKTGSGESTKLEREYRHARSFYEELLREDPNVRNLIAWESAGAELQQFIRNHPESNYDPDALFSLGRLFERTYSIRHFSTGLTKAMFFYEQLSRDYRGNPLADDALLSLGDLRKDGAQDLVGARAAYFEIVDRYPKGDKAEEAKARLGVLDQAATGSDVLTNDPTLARDALKKLGRDRTAPNESTAKETIGSTKLAQIFGASNTNDGRDIVSVENSVQRPLIVIDPGHGGDNMGAVGVGGILEKDVTLNIAKEVDRLLRERLRARTILTRTTDVTLALADRTNIANAHNADLFISIHTNASELKNVWGTETYYLDNTHDKSSLKLAERENSAGGPTTGPGDLNFILSDFIQNAKLEDSIRLAHAIQDDLISRVSQYYEGTKSLGVKKAPFYVLVGAHMPCVLVEVAFIDHPTEGKRLAEPRYQTLVADGIFRGVKNYFEGRRKSDERSKN